MSLNLRLTSTPIDSIEIRRPESSDITEILDRDWSRRLRFGTFEAQLEQFARKY